MGAARSGIDRGHLLAQRLGGDGGRLENIVAMYQGPYRGQMRVIEGQVAAAVASGGVAKLRCDADLRRRNHAMSSLTIQATGTGFAIPPTPIVKSEPAGDVARLCSVIPPATASLAAPSLQDWELAESELSIALPSDYKELLTANGSSAIGEFLQPVRGRDDSTRQLRLDERGWWVVT